MLVTLINIQILLFYSITIFTLYAISTFQVSLDSMNRK